MSEGKNLIILTPLRKRLGGLWLAFTSIGAFLLRESGHKGSGSEILLVVAILLMLIALHRLLSYTVTVFVSGKVPKARQTVCHFGLFKSETDTEFNEIDILRRDNILPYCQLYAYSSMELLKQKLRTHELEPFEKNQKPLPGIVVVDHTTKKECEKHIENIWRFYGLWEEEKEESVIAAQEVDEVETGD